MKTPGLSEIQSLSQDTVPADNKKLVSYWYKLAPILVFLAAFAAFFVHAFYFGLPNMALLFDSQGYLWVAEALQKAFCPKTANLVVSYLASGFAEPARLELKDSLFNLIDICKTGPVITGYLAAFCALCGKAAGSVNWATAQTGMIFLQALTICGIFLWTRSLWGQKAAWLSLLVSLTYPGLVVNAGRPLSEIPLATGTIFFAYCLYRELSISFSGEKKPRFSSQLKGGLLPGLLLALLMLARPTMVLLPAILLPVILAVAKICRRRNPLSLGLLSGLVISAAFVLAPWIFCKLVFTGVPSLTVDRYGAWNIFAGTSLAMDGWDMLPEEYVSHPDRFKESMGEVGKHILNEIKTRPGKLAYLMLRKPARLVDSPWNDFQVSSWGMPFAWQRFWHQVLLLAALFGFFKLLADGWQKKDAPKLLAAGILGSLVLYQFVNCLFISMSRYFVAAIPCVLMLAAYGLERILFEFSGKRRLLLILGLSAAPLLSFNFAHLYATGYGYLCGPARELGVGWVAAISALAISLLVAGGLFIAAQIGIGLRHKGSKNLLVACGVVAAVFCFASSFDQYLALEGKIASNDNKIEMSLDLPQEALGKQLFLVMDSRYNSRTLAVNFNGHPLVLNWLPLLAWDLSQRENLAYAAAFAYSSGCRVEEIRQWYCAPISNSANLAVLHNTIKFTGDNTAPVVLCDLADGYGKNAHQLSLRKFSWSKGFFANSPGEMRANEWNNRAASFHSPDIAEPDAKLLPRLYVLAVDPSSANGMNGASEITGMSEMPARTIDLKIPDQKIGLSPSERMKVVEIPSANLPINGGLTEVLHITVEGQCRAPSGKGIASVALVETKAAHQEYAPLSPLKIQADSKWKDFAFDDLLPIASGDKSTPSLRLLFLARPWWEALQYAEYKGKRPVEFRNLRLQMVYEPALNLDKQKYAVYRAQIIRHPNSDRVN